MRTPITPGNPFGHDRYGFLWEALRAGEPGQHLDYGAHDGRVLGELARTGVIRGGVGVDMSTAAVGAARDLPDGVSLVTIPPPGRREPGAPLLPFPDGRFDSASLLDVLEHVADQGELLGELFRVLKPGAPFVVTVPGQHLFSALDLGNLKFRFPRAHRAWYSARHGAAAYHERYVACPDGLVGDIEKAKSWHEHFTPDGLGALLGSAGFDVQAFDGSGLWVRPLLPLSWVPGPGRPIVARVVRADARRFARANLFCLARRPT